MASNLKRPIVGKNEIISKLEKDGLVVLSLMHISPDIWILRPDFVRLSLQGAVGRQRCDIALGGDPFGTVPKSLAAHFTMGVTSIEPVVL